MISGLGQVIKTAVKNIDAPKASRKDLQKANKLAPSIKAAGRNVVPGYVVEIKRHHYRWVGSPVVLEAVKAAGLDSVHAVVLAVGVKSVDDVAIEALEAQVEAFSSLF